MSGVGVGGATTQSFKEIITKAVYGRGEGTAHGVVTFPHLADVKKVLGATATEFRVGDVSIDNTGGDVVASVNGQFNVHVWYMCGEDTAVAKQVVSATVEIPVKPMGREQYNGLSVRVWVVKQPECGTATISAVKDSVEVEVDATLAAELTGETKLKVALLPPAGLEPVSSDRAVERGSAKPRPTGSPPNPRGPAPQPSPPPLDWDDEVPKSTDHDD